MGIYTTNRYSHVQRQPSRNEARGGEEHLLGTQRTICPFSPSTRQALGYRNQIIRLGDNHLYLLSHLISLSPICLGFV